ncbi:MAG: DUF4919 domain-containing protein [Muribaculaceae bacterium]|nr:DUF4919 domain-containing protein [Muribaculaceae bacterium]
MKLKRIFSIILPAILLAAIPVAAAQTAAKGKNARKITVEKPDLEKIAKATLDPKSEFYFPNLMKTFNRNDTSMTKEQYRNLYLGYLFQEDYDPYRTSPYNAQTDSLLEVTTATKARLTAMTDSLNKLIKANRISGHEAEKQKERLSNTYKRQLRELSTATELSLKDNPFDLRQMSVLVRASKEMGNAMKAKIWEYRLENILGAIKSTGTGEDMDNAFYVIYPMHEYNMIQLLGYSPTAVDFPAEGFDYISVTPDADSGIKIRKPVEGFYFNVVPLTEQYELKHPEEQEASEE